MTEASVLFLSLLFIIAVVLYGFAIYVKRTGISFLFSVLSSMVILQLLIELSDYVILTIVFAGIIIFQFVGMALLFKRGND